MRILVVEDDQKIANALKRGLKQQSYTVDVAYTSDDGLGFALNEKYDLYILDRMLPGAVDGIGMIQKIRANEIQTPILMLTAKSRVLDKAEGLNAGADDYLAKPFAFVELLARVRALLRRPTAALPTKLSYDELTIDDETKQVTRSGTLVDLSITEFAVLEYFVRNPEVVISKNQLLSNVWGYDSDVLPNTAEVYIGYLRNKIDKPFSQKPPLLHTKRGFGYYLGREK